MQVLHEGSFACPTLAGYKYRKTRTNHARNLPLEFLHLRAAAKEEHSHSISLPLETARTQFVFQKDSHAIGTLERECGLPASQFFAQNAKIFAYFAGSIWELKPIWPERRKPTLRILPVTGW
jgi:hypothetical protein